MNNQESVINLIKAWNLPKELIAEKTGISAYTLRMKLNGKHQYYKFSDSDIGKIKEVLQELQTDISKALTTASPT